MKKTLAKIMSSALIAATVLGVSAVPADACHDCDITVLPNGFTMESHKGVYWEEDLEELDKRVVDLTDPVEMYRVIMSSPANPQNGPAPKNQEEQAKYDRELAAFRENLIDTMREMGVELSVQEFEKLYSEKSAEEMPHAWLRFYRDEAMTDEYASVSDIAAGDTVYYKAGSEAGYYCTQVNIKCPTIGKGSFYANRPGDQIEYSVTAGIKGDLNNDGSLDAHDITIYLNLIVGKYGLYYDRFTNEYRRQRYDANGDGVDNAKDIIDLMKAMLGKVDLKGYSNDQYECVNYLYSYIISVRPWGSEEEYTMPLPAPLPTMELSEDKMSLVDHGIYWNHLFDEHYGFHGGSEYHGVTSEFWQGYVFAEKEVELVKGDRAPDIYVLDPNSYVGGVLSGYYLSYNIPEGAETEKVIVRFAFMTHETAREKGLIAY